jgi:photosystem II stability/assembly factor-like uncharacterized protein
MKKVTIFILFLLLIVHLSLYIEHCEAQWDQITLPVSGSVYHMQFINSNTGWATISQTNVGYILIRTTNQGTNWSVIYSDSAKVGKFQFINDTLGYAMGKSQGFYLMSKTTNSGYNWTIMQNTEDILNGFYMINSDTGWINAFSVPTTYTLRTTNGFQTMEQISTGGGGTPATLYFFKEKYNGEYCGYVLGAGILSKTTNSGYNWEQINIGISVNVNSFSFINKDTGWVVSGVVSNNNRILKTENSGTNFLTQFSDSNDYYRIQSVFALNSVKIWCGTSRNYLFATNNSGLIWGRQSSQILSSSVYIVDSNLGFAWNTYQIVKTTNGGGPITQIVNNNEQIAKKYELYQNYPNPFNQCTIINVQLPISKQIKINIYDIEGKLVEIIVNKKEFLGLHSYKFNASRLSSGVYFYSLFIDGIKLDTKKLIIIK